MTKSSDRLIVHVAKRVVPFAVVLLAILGYVGQMIQNRAAMERVSDNLERTVAVEAVRVATQLENLANSVAALAENDLIISGLFDSETRFNYLPALFRSIRLPGPDGAVVTLVDHKGHYIAGSKYGLSYESQAWIGPALRGRRLFHVGRSGIRLAFPVPYAGQPQGAVVTEYDPAQTAKLFAKGSGQFSVALIAADGGVIFATDDAARRLGAGQEDNDGWLVRRVAVPGDLGLSMIMARNKKAVDQAAVSGWAISLGALTVAFLAFGAAIVLTAYVTAAPIHHMAEGVRKITGAQDLDRKLDEGGPREVRELAAAFNAMTSVLSQENTARLSREQELRDILTRNELLAAAIESTTTGVTIADARQARPVIVYCNQAFLDINGCAKDEIIGTTGRQLTGPETDENTLNEIRSALKRREPVTVEIIKYRKDGSKFWSRLTVAPVFDNDGALAYFVGTEFDITMRQQAIEDRQRLESELIHAQKMESIGTLAGGIAHEINTPVQYLGDNLRFLSDAFEDLKVIIAKQAKVTEGVESQGAPELRELAARARSVAEEKDLAFLTDEIPQALDQSLEGVNHVAGIVLAMKEFAHPAAKEKTYIDLNRVIERAAMVSRGEYKHVADLELDLAEGLVSVKGLEGELNQVVLNLIVNASHAIRETGQERGTISLRTEADDTHVTFSVSDSGVGIPEEIRQRIFEPFFTTKDVGVGTGQGLAITRDIIVAKHGGEIHVDSTPGAGTKFTIRLPREPGMDGMDCDEPIKPETTAKLEGTVSHV